MCEISVTISVKFAKIFHLYAIMKFFDRASFKTKKINQTSQMNRIKITTTETEQKEKHDCVGSFNLEKNLSTCPCMSTK